MADPVQPNIVAIDTDAFITALTRIVTDPYDINSTGVAWSQQMCEAHYEANKTIFLEKLNLYIDGRIRQGIEADRKRRDPFRKFRK